LEAVLFVPDPTTLAAQPLSGGDGRHGAKDGYLVPLPAGPHPKDGIAALFVEISDALDKPCDLFGRCAWSWSAHPDWSLPVRGFPQAAG